MVSDASDPSALQRRTRDTLEESLGEYCAEPCGVPVTTAGCEDWSEGFETVRMMAIELQLSTLTA